MVKIKLGKSALDTVRIVPKEDQIVRPRFERWLLEHRDKPFSPEIARWVYEQLIDVQRVRISSFAGSSAGRCERAQVLSFLGIPTVEEDLTPQLQQIFNDGKWRHLRLQAQLMQSGIIEFGDMEVPLPWPAMRSMGTADGVGTVPDDHPNKKWRGKTYGLEIKGANHWVANLMREPTKYLAQVHRYILVSGWDLFVILVENKNSQELQEWVIEPDPVLIRESKDELKRLNRAVESKKLPPRLPACNQMTGEQFKSCPYGQNVTRPCLNLPEGRATRLYARQRSVFDPFA